MVNKIILSLSIFLIFSISFCNKQEEFIKFEQHMVIFPINNISEEIYSYDKTEKSHGLTDSLHSIETDGILIIFSKNAGKKQIFFRIKCPDYWDCKNGYGLLKRESLYLEDVEKFGENVSKENPALIIKKEDLDKYDETKRYIRLSYLKPFPKNGIQLKFLNFQLRTSTDYKFNRLLTMQLYYIYDIILNKKTDKRYDGLYFWGRGAKTFEKLISMNSDIELNEFITRENFKLDLHTYKELDKKAQGILEEELFKLFHILIDPKEIVSFFNDLSKYPYLKEKAFKQMLETISFYKISLNEETSKFDSLTNQNVNSKWKIDPNELKKLIEIPNNGNIKFYEILNIKANIIENKISFEITLEDNDVILLTSENIVDIFDGKNKLEKYISQLPFINEIINQNKQNPRKAAMLMALKIGKGKYDTSSSEFQYLIENDKAVFLLLKNNFAIKAKENEYIGSTSYNVSVFQGNPLTLDGWYQTHDKETNERSFYLNFTEMDCGCFECEYKKHYDELCYKSGFEFKITFPISSIFLNENENITISSDDIENKYCLSIFDEI